MAKGNRNSSQRRDRSSKRRKSAAEYRASHCIHSAASAERKREAGLTRVSVWVPAGDADVLKGFAKHLCQGRVPDDIGYSQATDGKITPLGITPAPRRKTRQKQSCDKRQLDLFETE